MNKSKQSTKKEYADSIRKFTDTELITLYNLALERLQSIALNYQLKLKEGLKND